MAVGFLRSYSKCKLAPLKHYITVMLDITQSQSSGLLGYNGKLKEQPEDICNNHTENCDLITTTAFVVLFVSFHIKYSKDSEISVV